MDIQGCFNFLDQAETTQLIAILACAIHENKSLLQTYKEQNAWIKTIHPCLEAFNDVSDPVQLSNMIIALGFKLHNTFALRGLKKELV